MLKKASRNKDADVPDIRADEPERAMEQFTDGLLAVYWLPPKTATASDDVSAAAVRRQLPPAATLPQWPDRVKLSFFAMSATIACGCAHASSQTDRGLAHTLD